MSTRKCARCISAALYPLVVISIICNILLFFPGWNAKYAKEGHLTEEVKYLGGLIGGGVMVLFPAFYLCFTGEQGCCGNRCGMFISIIFAAIGVAGGLYSFIVAALGLTNGPLCKASDGWGRHFKTSHYLTNFKSWGECEEPKNVVPFNTGLFITLMVASFLQVVLCTAQMINGLVGCLCGTCANKEDTESLA